MASKTCVVCGAALHGAWVKGTLTQSNNAHEISGRTYCSGCAAAYVKQAIESVLATTTPEVDGYRVDSYISVESVEVVIGTGPFSEFLGDIADLLGTRSTEFERKLQQGKQVALDRLKLVAHERGGNAVVGVDLDYTEFSGNRTGIVVNGTVVRIRPM